MLCFRRKYLSGKENERLLIMDLGSQDVNGSYKPCFENENWCYKGLDMAPGKNVDIVLDDPYCWKEVRTSSVDVLVSGQAFEHVEFFWVTIMEIARILKPGGLACIIAPSGGYEHKYPLDCWRFYPDGFRALGRYAGLVALEAFAQWENDPDYRDDSNFWHDCVLVAEKPKLSLIERMKFEMRSRAGRILIRGLGNK